MEDVRALKIETLKASITRADYQIDAAAVAEAMIRRPSARLWVIPDGVLVSGPAVLQCPAEPGPGPGSGNVLEAS